MERRRQRQDDQDGAGPATARRQLLWDIPEASDGRTSARSTEDAWMSSTVCFDVLDKPSDVDGSGGDDATGGNTGASRSPAGTGESWTLAGGSGRRGRRRQRRHGSGSAPRRSSRRASADCNNQEDPLGSSAGRQAGARRGHSRLRGTRSYVRSLMQASSAGAALGSPRRQAAAAAPPGALPTLLGARRGGGKKAKPPGAADAGQTGVAGTVMAVASVERTLARARALIGQRDSADDGGQGGPGGEADPAPAADARAEDDWAEDSDGSAGGASSFGASGNTASSSSRSSSSSSSSTSSISNSSGSSNGNCSGSGGGRSQPKRRSCWPAGVASGRRRLGGPWFEDAALRRRGWERIAPAGGAALPGRRADGAEPPKSALGHGAAGPLDLGTLAGLPLEAIRAELQAGLMLFQRGVVAQEANGNPSGCAVPVCAGRGFSSDGSPTGQIFGPDAAARPLPGLAAVSSPQATASAEVDPPLPWPAQIPAHLGSLLPPRGGGRVGPPLPRPPPPPPGALSRALESLWPTKARGENLRNTLGLPTAPTCARSLASPETAHEAGEAPDWRAAASLPPLAAQRTQPGAAAGPPPPARQAEPAGRLLPPGPLRGLEAGGAPAGPGQLEGVLWAARAGPAQAAPRRPRPSGRLLPPGRLGRPGWAAEALEAALAGGDGLKGYLQSLGSPGSPQHGPPGGARPGEAPAPAVPAGSPRRGARVHRHRSLRSFLPLVHAHC
ncbi:unnamed protein product [Prorocentrum cordatum]|uniref:Uncharacterized protein n=1 Tax=Prorocentrum cordatum TaxID=2364126 RepID=A0ABN9Y054_9DINO|nr:unnamed protein product [Polarella glacialis]